MKQRQDAERDDHVVRQRQYRAERQTPLETEADVNQDRDQRHQQRHAARLRQIAADAGADELNALHGGVLTRRLVNYRDDLVAQLLTRVTGVRRQTHHHVATAAEVLHLRFDEARFFQRTAQRIEVGRLLQRNLNHGAAGEVEPPVEAAHAHDDHRRDQQQPRKGKGQRIPAHKVMDFTAIV